MILITAFVYCLTYHSIMIVFMSENNFLADKTPKELQNMEVMKPSADLGARVDGGASGATSQLTSCKEANHEEKYQSIRCCSNLPST